MGGFPIKQQDEIVEESNFDESIIFLAFQNLDIPTKKKDFTGIQYTHFQTNPDDEYETLFNKLFKSHLSKTENDQEDIQAKSQGRIYLDVFLIIFSFTQM